MIAIFKQAHFFLNQFWTMNYCLFTQKNDKIPGTSLYAVLLYESVEETEKMKLYSASPFSFHIYV